ncbi:MAG: DUF362 domain-containing protein [Candidatus Tectomicrobia bacterium]|nr:DUF362 domain-containing protein [Candidatus Tectomicrobia bacterium]
MRQRREQVFLQRGDGAYGAARRLLERMGFGLRGKRVFVKPNLVNAKSAAEGVTTDLGVCRAIFERLEDCRVTLGDAGGDTKASLRRNGYTKLCREFGVETVDLNDDEIVWLEVPRPVVYERVPFSRRVLEAEVRIDVAKLKLHSSAQVTLTLKNWFGCVPTYRERSKIHPRISRAIVDLVQVAPPHLCLIDGIIGNNFNEVTPSPIHVGIMIGGRDALAVDIVGTQCMGINPDDIVQLTEARRILGERTIAIDGPAIEEVMVPFLAGV